jgi:hypothetical protein
VPHPFLRVGVKIRRQLGMELGDPTKVEKRAYKEGDWVQFSQSPTVIFLGVEPM